MAKAKAKKKAEVVEKKVDSEDVLLAKSAVGGEGGEGKLASVEYTEERLPGKVE